MMQFLKMIVLAIAGIWTAFRAAEEGLGAWVRRETRDRDLSGLAWA
jgi:hypothetical protein